MSALPGCFINLSQLGSQQSVKTFHLNSNYTSCHIIKITSTNIAVSSDGTD